MWAERLSRVERSSASLAASGTTRPSDASGAELAVFLARSLSLDPIRQIVQGLKGARPQARVIVFVRGGGANLARVVEAGFAAARGRPHIFNLGHGIVPETPIDHVEAMIAQVRGAE
jgi:uroporphyrinogen decarboxylase